ncbi:MAG: hypothetical protein ABJP45_14810 [Cyclobacteriaceae bacterium]
MKATILILSTILTLKVYGQELEFGDSTILQSIKPLTAEIYGNKDETFFFLSKMLFQEGAQGGTSFVAHSRASEVNRIITTTFTSEGQLSCEWYFQNGSLIFSYQVFEYFAESSKKGFWKNFKGLTSWESRYYFEDLSLRYHRHKGRRDIDESLSAKAILAEAQLILEFVEGQIKDQE